MKDFLGKTGRVVYKKAKDVMMTVKDLMVKMGCVVYNKAKDVMVRKLHYTTLHYTTLYRTTIHHTTPNLKTLFFFSTR